MLLWLPCTADAMEKAGGEGIITVEESKTTETLGIAEGMQFDRGYMSPYFVTDSEKVEAVACFNTQSFPRVATYMLPIVEWTWRRLDATSDGCCFADGRVRFRKIFPLDYALLATSALASFASACTNRSVSATIRSMPRSRALRSGLRII
jgi:hypothetical protein